MRTDDQAMRRFHELVNMTQGELRSWLGTAESKSVGQHVRGRRSSIGRASGLRTLRMRIRDQVHKSDIAHMRRVIGFISRHLAQRPHGDLRHTRWRYSLMNWGHDPLGLGHL